MQVILFEDYTHFDLLPFTFTRPVYALRTGIYTNLERWQLHLSHTPAQTAFDYLGQKFNTALAPQPAIWVNGKFMPDAELLRLIQDIPENHFYVQQGGDILAAHFSPAALPGNFEGIITKELLTELGMKEETLGLDPLSIRFPEDLFLNNGKMIRRDFEWATREKASEKIRDPHSRIYGADNIYVSEGVSIKAAIINAEDGPIYIGKEARIHEGAIIRNGHAILDHAHVNVGGKLRGDSTLGPYCKVGGEVTNSILMGYSNKGHEGYLGNSVLGFWCNLGADTNTSNLKNNYTNVRVWHYPSGRFRDTGQQFCGLMMGDHSKAGINTMFNTGTVVGVSANIYGSGYPRTYIPSFSWGGALGFTTYKRSKAEEVATAVMARRKLLFDEKEKHIFAEVFSRTAEHRRWEKGNGVKG